MNLGNLLWWSQFLVLGCCGTAYAGGSLFNSDEVLDIDLRGPLQQTISERTDRNAYAFDLSVDGKVLPVSVRVRGNSRMRICRFPPLRFDFTPENVERTLFEGQSKLKLVTHCKTSASYEQNVLEEYAAYRMFAMLTNVSFRTRLLRIRYFDTDKSNQEPLVRYAFLIESAEDLAARVGGEALQVPHVVKTRLDSDQAALVFVFHYLIASADWSLVNAAGDKYCCHNVNLVAIEETDHPVPYDFDLSGLVSPRYARQGANEGVVTVRKRRYRGYCIEETSINTAVQSMLDHEAGFSELLKGLPGASKKETARRLKFLGSFYSGIEDKAEYAANLNRRCVDR